MKRAERLCALLLAVSLLLGGCAAARQNDGTRRVYLIAKSGTTEFWKSVFAGADAAKSEYNVELTILNPETEEQYEQQNSYIRQAVAEGADAIIFSAISYTGNAAAIEEAIAAGVRVVIIDSDVDAAGVSARIGTDNVAAGRMSAQAALDTDMQKLCVGIVNCGKETQNCQEREQGFREALREDARVSGIYTVNVATDQYAAKRATQELLKAHPEINVLVGFNEPLAVGTALAVKELGLGGQVREIAFDTNVRCIDLLQEGVVSALIVQNPYAMGYLGVEYAWKALQGEKLDAAQLIDTATKIVTREDMFTMENQKSLFSFN